MLTSIHEKVEPEPGVPPVTFCHATSKINPWALSPDSKASLGGAGECWVDFLPQTRVENDCSPAINVTCQMVEFGFGGQGVAGPTPEQARVWQGKKEHIRMQRDEGAFLENNQKS